MSGANCAVVQRARRLIGVPFRPQGRDPVTGLDCVGVAINAFEIDAALIRRDYRLRGDHNREIRQTLERWFERVPGDGQQGDLILCAVRFNRPHFAIHCGRSFIHADARLRRVAETPGLPEWPVLTILRPIETQTS